MLKSANVPLQESVLLVIDAQDSFKVGERWNHRNNLDFEANVGQLIDAYRAQNLPVIFFLHTDEDLHFSEGSPHFKLMDFIQPQADEPVMIKSTRNCFTSTNLQSVLLSNGVRRLAITGIQMEQCCETTTRVGADLGYALDFVMDGTMTFPITDIHDKTQILAVDAIEERTKFALQGRFARVIDTQTMLSELATL